MQTPLQLVNTTAIPNVENTSKKGLILKEIKVLKKKNLQNKKSGSKWRWCEWPHGMRIRMILKVNK